MWCHVCEILPLLVKPMVLTVRMKSEIRHKVISSMFSCSYLGVKVFFKGSLKFEWWLREARRGEVGNLGEIWILEPKYTVRSHKWMCFQHIGVTIVSSNILCTIEETGKQNSIHSKHRKCKEMEELIVWCDHVTLYACAKILNCNQ